MLESAVPDYHYAMPVTMYGDGSHATMAWLAVSIWAWRVSVVAAVSTHAPVKGHQYCRILTNKEINCR